MERIEGDLYDYPVYYDLVYGSDWRAEYEFLFDCMQQYVEGSVPVRLFEPACGTGRLLYRFAKQGYIVSGLDLNRAAVDYCNERLTRHDLNPAAFVADMSDFQPAAASAALGESSWLPFDFAFNTVGSFRHLLTEQQAVGHLKCMAKIIRPGGIYVLGFHLTPSVGEPTDTEEWFARRGSLSVQVKQWLDRRDLAERREVFGMSYDVTTATKQFQIYGQVAFRTYSLQQWQTLMSQLPQWETAAVHDFAYDSERQTKLDGEVEDVIFVLRRCPDA